MKYFFLSIFICLGILGWSQPNKIHYQGIAYGSTGGPIAFRSIGLKISILDSLSTGPILYSETHQPTTDGAGQFSIFIGTGTVLSGVFEDIPWGNGNEKFLKMEMDELGGTNFALMGVTPLVSVPYAITAGSLIDGTILYGTSGKNYRLTVTSSGPVWTCYPPAPVANAGVDQLANCNLSILLAGNALSGSTSVWEIISGLNGVLADSSLANSVFTGRANASYSLKYTLSNACGSSSDTVNVSFQSSGYPANAGADILGSSGNAAVTLSSNFPSLPGEVGTWKVVQGTGGVFSDIHNPDAIFVRGVDSVYLLEWSLTNSCGITRDTVLIDFDFFPLNIPCPGAATVTHDGTIYPTVLIKDQCWMAKNLNVGSTISTSISQSNNSLWEKYCYNNIPANCDTFGGLYQWAEAVQYQNGANNASLTNPALPHIVQGICPNGWHLPTSDEFISLSTLLGDYSIAGSSLKSTSSLWNAPNDYATNLTGFSALPGGNFSNVGGSSGKGDGAFFWQVGENALGVVFGASLSSSNAQLPISNASKNTAFSVRCLKDTLCSPSLAVAGNDQINLSGSTALISANPPGIGESGTWAIISGTGARFSNNNSPNSTFFIGTDTTYTLTWTISGACGISVDTLVLSFVCVPPTANAGIDQNAIGVVYLAGNSPSSGVTGSWSVISGNGGVFTSVNDPNSTFSRGTDSLYTLAWSLSGPCGNSTDTVKIKFLNLILNSTCLGANSITYQGKIYPIVRIGSQCWFKNNINVGAMISSTSAVDSQTNNGVIEKYCYQNLPANCDTFGGLYQWAEAVQYRNGANNTSALSSSFAGFTQGICPSGWHIPSKSEVELLDNYLGGAIYSNYALKSTSNLWKYGSGATDSSGFSGLPSGYRISNGSFGAKGQFGTFWTVSENSGTRAFERILRPNSGIIPWEAQNKDWGQAIRCLKDTLCTSSTSSAGPDQVVPSGATATLAANTPAAGETGTWTIISGSGATLSNANSPTAMFTKGASTAYSLVWTITGPCGSSSDTMDLVFPRLIFYGCGDSISYYGKDYPSIQVGTQCWLGKNLNVGSMTNANNQQSNNGSFEKYCYNNLVENCDTFGGLYQWAEAVNYANGAGDSTQPSPAFSGNVQGICPTGWHLPTREEWCKMMVYLDPTFSCNFFGSGQNGTDIVGKLKSKTLWNLPNVGATDTVHFSAIPGGMYVKSFNAFTGKGTSSQFWLSYSTSGISNNFNAWQMGSLYYSSSNFGYNPFANGTKSDGQSIRCVHDVALTCSISKANAGADQLTITDTVASLQGNLPKLGEQVGWNVISGNGGSFSNPSDPHATFTRGGVEDSVYFLEYNIVGDCGISRDTVKIQFKFNCGNEIKVPYWDNTTFPATLSNRVYPTVKIGNQCWMSKNLNAGDMINSAAAVDSQRNNGVVEKYCYNNNLGYCDAYGGLYQWAEAVQYKNGATNSTLTTPSLTGFVQGICPTGWHLPMDSEWTNLETTLGGSTVAGGALKSTSTSWTAPNVGATNSSGYSALPAGYRPSNGTFGNINIAAFFWSTLESSASQAKARFLVNSGGNSSWVNTNKTAALSIRCIKD